MTGKTRTQPTATMPAARGRRALVALVAMVALVSSTACGGGGAREDAAVVETGEGSGAGTQGAAGVLDDDASTGIDGSADAGFAEAVGDEGSGERAPDPVAEPEPEPEPEPQPDPWELALTTCPDPEVGSLADTWVWSPPTDEADVLALDLDGDGTTFDLLAAFEGTSIIVRVRDAETGDAAAVIKTNSSNTRVTAEIYAYRLAVFLGFEHLVPPSSPIAIDDGALEKMRDLLAGTSYADEYKERARLSVVRDLDAALAEGGAYEGALKPWLGAFMFTQALGERDRLATHPVMAHLLANGPQPDDTEVELVQITRLYSPNGTHRGRLSMADLAEDVSNVMLMDALMGQNDRFAGANLHFQAVDGGREEVGERSGMPVFDLGAVRLLALDNGAALRSRHGTGMSDLLGGIESGTRVERFEPETVDRLRALGRRAIGYGCETAPFDDEVDAIWAYLGIDDLDRRARAAGLLGDVLAHIGALEARHGDGIELRPDVAPEVDEDDDADPDDDVDGGDDPVAALVAPR